jgi:hypothetical protein
MFGRTFAASSLSIGASAFWSDLGSVDGTNLMYFDSRSVDQTGRAADLRLGMLKEWSGGQSLEALVFSRRLRMTHDVTYGDRYWDPTAHTIILRDRLEFEQDQTNTWGMHLEYARPIGDSGWRAGVILTANRISNPSRPAFEMETVAGGRGRSSAFNLGVGVARTLGKTTVAADAIYEPIWSRIWDVNDSLAATTIDNRLRYSNAVVRTGVNHDLTISSESTLQFQLGVQARSMNYTHERHNLISGSRTNGESSWMEWTRAWGLSLRRTAFEVNYRGRIMTGASRPGMPPVDPSVILASGRALDVFVATPSGPELRDVTVSTHQFSVSLFVR